MYAVESVFGLVLHNGYGVTECSPTIAQTRVESPRTDTSVGPVFPGVEVKLLGPDCKPVAEGKSGRTMGAWTERYEGLLPCTRRNRRCIDADGWFNTRDLARSELGNLFIVRRAKELIVRFGLNVYPAEVEAVLNAHPAVVRSAVVGRSVAGAEGDEEVVAFVQPLPGSSLTDTALAEHAASSIQATIP